MLQQDWNELYIEDDEYYLSYSTGEPIGGECNLEVWIFPLFEPLVEFYRGSTSESDDSISSLVLLQMGV